MDVNIRRANALQVLFLAALTAAPLLTFGQATTAPAAPDPAKLAQEREQKLRAFSKRTARSPEVVHVSLVAPDVLSIVIEAQKTIRSSVIPYEKREGDEVKPKNWSDGVLRWSDLFREGKRIGRLFGKDQNFLSLPEKLDGDPLLDFLTEDPANYTVTSTDDPAFASATKPSAVYRKTKPRDVVLPGGQHPTRHRLYLKLPAKLQPGKTYAIKIDKVNVKVGDLKFVADLPNTQSESVHVNQIGYRPDDPAKQAFLSLWQGTGGAYEFQENLPLSIISAETGLAVFSGKVLKVLNVNGKEELWTKPPKNYSATAIYSMDFSALKTPGKYRVYVEGIGCSYPFDINDTVWQTAFTTQMRGLYNQRSGVELGPPYTDFKRPRDFHPDDGAVAQKSTYDMVERGANKYEQMRSLSTGEKVLNAWGGYHDAGDWNPRRVTHMYTTLSQLEVCELFPDHFLKLKLNIPPIEGGANIPDILNEAMFEVDCFRRIQWDNGAMPAAIETEGDPLAGEVSWLSTQQLYVLAPTIRDSWLYAAVAARLAHQLKPFNATLAKTYEDSAVKAFTWAETEFARKEAAGEPMPRDKYWQASDARNLSALLLYQLTDQASYHDLYKKTALLDGKTDIAAWGWAMQSEAAFLYARMPVAKTDPTLKAAAKAAIVDLAERSLKYAAGNAFNLTQREKGRPLFAGFFSTSGGVELVRAHFLTQKKEYLAGAVRSCQFQSGCNPNNLVYTTGLGANPVTVPLEVDARAMGQKVPVGLTVFGNTDYFNHPNTFWDMNLKFVNKPEFIHPNAYEWPLTEAYFEAWTLVSANEYVIDTWWPNLLVWGYLSARPPVN